MAERLNEQEQRALESYIKHQSYMKAYNKRTSVKAKRRVYNQERWAEMKAAAKIAKERGLL